MSIAFQMYTQNFNAMVRYYDKGVSKAKYHCYYEFHASFVD